jgi:hypothetical protein
MLLVFGARRLDQISQPALELTPIDESSQSAS